MNNTIINQLKTLKPILKDKFGIEEFAVFGSVAKGTDTINSDVDIAILKSNKKNFFIRMDAIEYLQKNLNKPIDMGYYDSMKTFIKNRIKKDFIYV
jgi:hypothetical protein